GTFGATVSAQGRQALPVGPRVSTALEPYRSRQGHGRASLPYAVALQPQISFLDGIISQKFSRGAGTYCAAVFQDIGAVGDVQRLVDVLSHQQDRHLLGVDTPNTVKKFSHE